eukprot:8234197-Lingulodinium_polyedra.AAC.1
MRTPPDTALAGPGAPQTLDLSPQALLEAGVPPEVVAEPPGLYGAGLDVRDGFYQNLVTPLCDLFGFDWPAAASEYGVSE